MDTVEPAALRPSEQLSAGDEPAFSQRWNGWTVLWVFAALAILFVIVQIAATVAWLYVGFPDVLRAAQEGNVGPLQALLTPTGLAKVLTAQGFIFIQGLTTAIMVPATISLSMSALGISLKDLGFGRSLSPSTALVAIGSGIGLFILSVLLQVVQDQLFGSHPQQIALILAKHHGFVAITLDLISAAVLAPLFEETLFRGVLFTALVQRMRLPLAAILSGIAFGMAHLDAYNFLLLAAVGAGLAYVYYYTRTIWANMVTHATFNALGLLLPLLFPQLNN